MKIGYKTKLQIPVGKEVQKTSIWIKEVNNIKAEAIERDVSREMC